MKQIPLENKRWTDEWFHEYLEEVRSWYPTGREVNLNEVLEYRRRMAPHRDLVRAQTTAEAEGNILVCPRGAFATVEQTLEMHRYVREAGGSDLVRISTDTYTRRLEFDRAKKALEESLRTGKSLLNGFPSVIHGVSGCRRLYEGIDLPITSPQDGTHGELHFLISLASGAGEASADAFQTINNSTDPLEKGIVCRQFVDRLVGWFEEHGIRVFKSNKFAHVLDPQCIRLASNIMGMLLAAEQGVKHFNIQSNTNLSVVQDVAAQRVLRKLPKEYLKRLGYDGTITVGFSLYNGPHPPDRSRAFSYILLGTAIAKWGGASRLEGRTVDEGLGLPTKEGQAMSLKATREMLYLLRNQKYPESEELALECQMIERETRAIVDKALELGDGDIAVGAVKALEQGTLDYTFPCNKHIPGKIVTVRDRGGSVRFLDCGNLPFSDDVKAFHRQKVAERMRAEKRKEWQLIIEDISGKAYVPASPVAG